MAENAHMRASPVKGTPVRELHADAGEVSLPEIATSSEPVILRGLIKHWPAVQAAKTSKSALVEYLSSFDAGAVLPVSAGPASLKGRVFYNDDFTGVNVQRGKARYREILQRIFEHGGADPAPLIYLASADVDECMPGFRASNDIDLGDASPLASIWIGTHTRIAAHNDLPLNIACVVAGKRRFTLFPPDQTGNLYTGPFEPTPAGRPISLVDFANPDFDRFPKFRDAAKVAQIAELAPGDALFLPSMWWHHVEAEGAFNVLVNYWWRTAPAYLGTPQDALSHAMLTIRNLPPRERKIWREIFDYYVFDWGPSNASHIPEKARGMLGPMTIENARGIRARLLNKLNR